MIAKVAVSGMLLAVSLSPLITKQAVAYGKKPQIVVQVYATDWRYESQAAFVDAYLIFADGTHAKGFCGQAPWEPSCSPESFTPEKRDPKDCKTIGKNRTLCVYKESYYAERNGNKVTIHAANGKITYLIVSSWDVDALTNLR